ncbi:MAG: hypothetical protein HN368_22005, partial [Spirochaetales bacterium]|nr:hypothetical protein [Spirochaetales bacterium]
AAVSIASAKAEEIAFTDVSIDFAGRIRIRVESTTDFYYILYRRNPQTNSETAVSMFLGGRGSTILTEPLGADGSTDLYKVMRYSRNKPEDTDGDGIDDVKELLNPIAMGPLNPAGELNFIDGAVTIPDRETFKALSYQGEEVFIDTHLTDLEFVKFYILETDTKNPEVLFMNTKTHRAHRRFAQAVGISGGFGGGRRGAGIPGQMRGEIVYHPNVIAPSGKRGLYRFEFEPNDSYPFEEVSAAYELLAASMPFLENNMVYYPMPNAALPKYRLEKDLYDASRIEILLEDEIYSNIGYLPLDIAEGFGLLRQMELNERPNSRDIVLYDALPNEMPRVAGIITTVPQTPLSHVNLRAVQDGVPNAFVKGALDNERISSLIGKYVYLKVDAGDFYIREAARAEVESHFSDMRPENAQVPARDLSVVSILPLDEIAFESSSSFGAKTANLAALRTFGFPNGTVPDGFGIPFYYYDEFMKFNGFYEQAEEMLQDPEFQSDYNVQEMKLAEFRESIKDGDMPRWMWNALSALQVSFPFGTSLRCRSSTNNEDLPGWSGAGLYDSKTQHPDEGHLSKSVKQVYASLWNFRAFDERQFHRIDHLTAAMGVLVHQNFEDERANGVAVTIDPIYLTENTYYLNIQVQENLVTNPDALSIPEELLISSSGRDEYRIVRSSNQVPSGERVLSIKHVNELRTYLKKIQINFSRLYKAGEKSEFAMEVEFKITDEGKLVIKQARPWVRTAAASAG